MTLSIIRQVARLGFWSAARRLFKTRTQPPRSSAHQAGIPNRRRLTRIEVGVPAHIVRSNGSVLAARCLDANDEAFSVYTDAPFRTGELVKLTLGPTGRAPRFIAQVVWCRDGRIGLRCNASD